MMCLKSFILVSLAIFMDYIIADSLPVISCGGSALVKEVRLTGCSKYPCLLKKGKKFTLEYDFEGGEHSSTITNSVYGIINRVSLPFIGVNGAPACQKTTPIDLRTGARAINVPSCPIFSGQAYTYSNTFPILSIYPTTDVTVQYGAVDGKGEKIACFIIPARIA
ncbi:NPC intracellular cholesterol transporter 2 homolog a-like [Artemia franciscana]